MRVENGNVISIPSPIDVHVHLREPGGEDKETIYTGTRSALYGGFQAVFDMPNNPAPYQTWTEERLDQKIEIAKDRSMTSIGFYAGVDLENPNLDEIPKLIRKAAGLKLYMGHTTGNTKEYDFDSVRPVVDAWREEGRKYGKTPPILLHAREDVGADTAGYIAWHSYPVHWCHLSTETEANFSRVLTEGFPELYTGGVTAHHLTMTARNADYQQGWNGARMQPPLGNEDDAEALRRGYIEGNIKILETDHAPQLPDDKLTAEADNPTGETGVDCTTCFGISGNEHVLSVMIALVMRKIIPMERLIDSLYDQPIRMLGLRRSQLPTQTVLEINPRVITEKDRKGRSSNNPYVGWMGGAAVRDVIIDGRGTFGRGILHQTRILRSGESL